MSERPPGAGESVVDPVCGLSIEPDRAAGRRFANDADVHFCSEICTDRFDADPDRFTAGR